MMNIYFKDEPIQKNDLYFVCSMIERVARKIHQPNSYVVNTIGEDEFRRLLSIANVQHCENPDKVVADWIEDYALKPGDYDVTKVNPNLVKTIPRATQMGKVYMRLILNTLDSSEDYAQGILRVYNDSICEVLDNYNASAYYEPSYVITRAYRDGGF